VWYVQDRREAQGRTLKNAIFWLLSLLPPLIAAAVGIEVVSYGTIPNLQMTLEGDTPVVFDPEIGLVPSPHASTRRVELWPDGKPKFGYNVYTDQRGARVDRPGLVTSDHMDALFIGDSFTWGAGVEAQNTFADGVAGRLGISVSNLSNPGYGTLQALQLLQRNRDLTPRVIVYTVIAAHMHRNLAACVSSYYPFCFDGSHVAWVNGAPKIVAPISNGLRRFLLHVEAQRHGLWPHVWVAHGLDVIFGKILLARDDPYDPAKQSLAMKFLLDQMAATAKSMRAELLVVYVPLYVAAHMDLKPAPPAVVEATSALHVQLLDLTPTFQRHDAPSLFIPSDGHPNVAGHALIADEIAEALRAGSALKE
jgi:lysophospholipase L1-like esterase